MSKKDTVFYIKELCDISGCRYDIENNRFIKPEEDMLESLKWTVRRELRPIIRDIANKSFPTQFI